MEKSSPDDEVYLQLMNELARYDYLLEQLAISFQNGFTDLSRANYHNKDSLNGKYGMDYYDTNYEGQYDVSIDSKSLAFKFVEKKPIKQREGANNNDNDEQEIRKRTDKKGNNKSQEKKKIKKKGPYDPLMMFGGGLSIPSSLRSCQSNFKSSLPLIEQLITCKYNINNLSKEIESSKIVKY